MNTKNCKTNETHKIFLNLWQRLDLKSEEKRVALQNVSIYDIWKNIRKQYKKKTKNYTTTMECQIWITRCFLFYVRYSKKHEALTAIPPIHVYTNKINNRLSLKIKDGDISYDYKCLKQLNHLAAQKNYWQHKKWRKRTKPWSSWSSFSPMWFSR